MKRVIVQIEFIEDEETKTKPMMFNNILVVPDKSGYQFFYHDVELHKLKLKSASLVEVKIMDDRPELIVEKK